MAGPSVLVRPLVARHDVPPDPTDTFVLAWLVPRTRRLAFLLPRLPVAGVDPASVAMVLVRRAALSRRKHARQIRRRPHTEASDSRQTPVLPRLTRPPAVEDRLTVLTLSPRFLY